MSCSHVSELKSWERPQCITVHTAKIIFLIQTDLCGILTLIVEMQNIYNLIGWNSKDNSGIFNCPSANIRKLSGIYKTFQFILT